MDFVMKVCVFLLLALSTMVAQTSPKTLTDDQWVESVFYPATVLLYVQDVQGGMHFACTATAIEHTGSAMPFAADTYTFVTAAHCVSTTDSKEDKVEMNKGQLYITTDDPNEKKFIKAKVLYAGSQKDGNDFSLLEVKTRDKFPLVPLGKDATSVVGEPVVNVSAPLGFGKQVFMGRVTSPKADRPLQMEDFTWTGYAMLQITGTGPGSSGSANVCLRQRAICSLLIGTAGPDTFAVPISHVTTYLNAKK